MMNSGLAQKLEAVVAGVLSLESVLADPDNFEGAAKASFHGLQHYLSDADIRAKDSAYREMQYGEMQKLLRLLKSGAGAEALAKITFLGVSGE
jgi:hypothetical protein